MINANLSSPGCKQRPREPDPRGPRPRGADPGGPRPRGADPRGPRPRGADPRGPRPRRADPWRLLGLVEGRGPAKLI